MRTFASLFTGGDLAGVGARLAGLTPIYGVEYDNDISDVAEMNGTRIIRNRVEDVDYSNLESPFWLHMSPVCVNASQAKQDKGETAEDIDSGKACARAIGALRSPQVSLENVWNYRNFQAFKTICNELTRQGYQYNFWHLNSVNYGVPQTRKRLILLASLTHLPQRPPATHTKIETHGLFGSLPKWVGWYEAIEDLISGLPESEFADWQLKRLSGLAGNTLITEQYDAPSGSDGRAPVQLSGSSPASTVLANHAGKLRAFIVEGTAAGEDNKFNLPVRQGDEPIFTVRGGNKLRAFIVDGKPANYAGDLQVIRADEPAVPITATQPQHPFRARLPQGRVVSMTPRALARFQSIPDFYALPAQVGLATKIVGNAVPCLLMQRIVESEMAQILRAAA